MVKLTPPTCRTLFLVATKGGKVTNPKKVTVKKGKKAVSKITIKKGKTIKLKSTVKVKVN